MQIFFNKFAPEYPEIYLIILFNTYEKDYQNRLPVHARPMDRHCLCTNFHQS